MVSVKNKRITIRLDDELATQAKQLAERSGRTLSAVIEDALREILARQREAARRPPVRLPTVSGKGLLPGVDLDNSAALMDLIDGLDGPDRR